MLGHKMKVSPKETSRKLIGLKNVHITNEIAIIYHGAVASSIVEHPEFECFFFLVLALGKMMLEIIVVPCLQKTIAANWVKKNHPEISKVEDNQYESLDLKYALGCPRHLWTYYKYLIMDLS